MTTSKLMLGLGFALALAMPLIARADPPGDPTAVSQDEHGMWRDKNGDPTYKIRGRDRRLVHLLRLPSL